MHVLHAFIHGHLAATPRRITQQRKYEHWQLPRFGESCELPKLTFPRAGSCLRPQKYFDGVNKPLLDGQKARWQLARAHEAAQWSQRTWRRASQAVISDHSPYPGSFCD